MSIVLRERVRFFDSSHHNALPRYGRVTKIRPDSEIYYIQPEDSDAIAVRVSHLVEKIDVYLV